MQSLMFKGSWPCRDKAAFNVTHCLHITFCATPEFIVSNKGLFDQC